MIMYGYIYLTTNLVNGKKYIGRRTSKIFLGNKYLGSGSYFKKAVNKYGAESFEVTLIQECFSYEELVERETYWIKYYDAVNSSEFYNQSYGGIYEGFIRGNQNIINNPVVKQRMINSKIGYHWTQEQKDKLKYYYETHKEEVHERQVRRIASMSKESRDNWKHSLSVASSKRKHTEEECLKISEANKDSKLMNNGKEQHWVKPDKFEEYLSNGYVFGGLSRNVDRLGSKNPMYGLKGSNNPNYGRVTVNNGTQRKKVKPEELDSYLEQGWVIGWKLKL